MVTKASTSSAEADEAQFLGHDGGDEIGVRFGQKQHLLATVAEAYPGHAAGTEAHPGLDDLVAAGHAVLERIGEGDDALPAVLGRSHQEEGDRQRDEPRRRACNRSSHLR